MDELVAQGYDRIADAYARLEGEAEWPRMRWLDDLVSRLASRSRVLDLGCGSGVPALRALVDRGHSAVGVDVSGEQLARAARNVPEAELIHASALDLDLPAGSLDAVVAFYVVDHLPREEHAALLASIHGWLRAGGWLLVTFEVDDEPGASASGSASRCSSATSTPRRTAGSSPRRGSRSFAPRRRRSWRATAPSRTSGCSRRSGRSERPRRRGAGGRVVTLVTWI